MKYFGHLLSGLVLLFALSSNVLATNQFDQVTLELKQVSGSVYMLKGAGGNIGISAGADGIVVIDDQFAELAPRIKDKLATLKAGADFILINTHYHSDHTGGNPEFSEQAMIMSHDQVRKRLMQKHEDKDLPVLTYEHGIKLYLNDEVMDIRHHGQGHTDGDSFIIFEKANVIHSGDLYFQGRFPYIDTEAGGSVDGYIKNIQAILKLANDDTKIIPGHGNLSNKAEYQQALEMILQTRAWISQQKQAGKSLQQTLKQGLPKKWKSWSWQFITEQKWIQKLWHNS